MSKRASAEEKVTQYFITEPIGAVCAIFNVVKGIVKARLEREGQSARVVASPEPKPRKKRTPKAKAVAVGPTGEVVNA